MGNNKNIRGIQRQQNLRQCQSNFFTNTAPTVMETKEKINKWDYIKIKSFYIAKETINKTTKSPLHCKTYLPMLFQMSVLLPKVTENSYNFNNRNINNPIKKWAKDLHRCFSKVDIQKAKRHMKTCSKSLIILELQIKMTMRHHVTPVRMASSTNQQRKVLVRM